MRGKRNKLGSVATLREPNRKKTPCRDFEIDTSCRLESRLGRANCSLTKVNVTALTVDTCTRARHVVVDVARRVRHAPGTGVD